MISRVPVSIAVLGAAAVALVGCATPVGEDDRALTVVASTSVYGSLAAAIGGDSVEVVSIIDSLSQDPHSYEASAREQLTVADADLILENGGGYDAFIDALIDASGSDATVLTAVEYSHDYPENDGHADDGHAEDDEHAEDDHAHDHAGHDHIEGFNEHVWYDPHTVVHLVEDIAHELGELDAANADTYEANAADLVAQIEGLEASLGEIAAENEGEQIFVTEPVPVYLAAAAGLVDATPAAFSEAVEEGQDVPPATLLEARDILASGDVRAVITNAQTGGAETTEIVSLAEDEGIPVIEFTELLPEGLDYVEWMQENIDALAGSLTE
ncbi:zinc/manganese transport system substrate-binding protein [Microbacterium marinum]|uniref:Zinc/manganese transport system substrate-binding protein n=1 Tax=Microbacterium marinum TaxID=421115 RepID=A0A7W7FI78_9MICO|nr:zinc ABC transporter substrate-binding protein [Microbacterium marinum]MBB4665828.1 zinc/manganese transport system substrate-binding protein [Microbacterium marinum]